MFFLNSENKYYKPFFVSVPVLIVLTFFLAINSFAFTGRPAPQWLILLWAVSAIIAGVAGWSYCFEQQKIETKREAKEEMKAEILAELKARAPRKKRRK